MQPIPVVYDSLNQNKIFEFFVIGVAVAKDI